MTRKPPDAREIDRASLPVVPAVEEPADTRPHVEIVEEPDALIVTADVSSAAREDVRVDVSPRRVVIAGVAHRGIDALAGRFRRERTPFFERAIALPAEVRPEGAKAHYNNGVLEVVLPKRAPSGKP